CLERGCAAPLTPADHALRLPWVYMSSFLLTDYGKTCRSIPALDPEILDLKTQHEIAGSVSIHISLSNLDRRCLGTCCAKADRGRIDCSCIKAVAAKNCHVDIIGAAGVDSIGVAFGPDVDR